MVAHCTPNREVLSSNTCRDASNVYIHVNLCFKIWTEKIHFYSRKKVVVITQAYFRNDTFRESSEASKPIKQQIKLLKQQEMDDYLAILENGSDFINAINWLPAGYLWSQTMGASASGFFGMVSSAVKLYRMHSWRNS